MQPMVASYQAGMRGIIMKAMSPFPAPRPASTFAKRLDAAFRSEKRISRTSPVLLSS